MVHVRDGRPALAGMALPALVSLDLLTLDHMPTTSCLYPGCVFLGGHSASLLGDTQPCCRDLDQAGVLPRSVCCEHVCGPPHRDPVSHPLCFLGAEGSEGLALKAPDSLPQGRIEVAS